jgi:hypothetical protein
MSEMSTVELHDLAAFFKSKAAELYERTDDGRYVACALRDIRQNPHPLPDFASDFAHSVRLRRVNKERLISVSEFLKKQGFFEFHAVAEGGTAFCYESQGIAIRIGPMPSASPSRVQLGDIRHCCPLVLQSHHSIAMPQAGMRSEIMPFVGMLEDGDIPESFQVMLPALLDKTCFEVNIEFKDLAVLPDGTPIYVDPGAINLKSWDEQPTVRDFDIIRENTQKLNLPEPLSWVLPDGRFKQELFFPKPVNALDLVL